MIIYSFWRCLFQSTSSGAFRIWSKVLSAYNHFYLKQLCWVFLTNLQINKAKDAETLELAYVDFTSLTDEIFQASPVEATPHKRDYFQSQHTQLHGCVASFRRLHQQPTKPDWCFTTYQDWGLQHDTWLCTQTSPLQLNCEWVAAICATEQTQLGFGTLWGLIQFPSWEPVHYWS